VTHGSHQESFGQRLRRLRRAANLSQTDLASDTVSASYVSLIESDKRVPSSAAVDALAQKLRCPPEMLLSGVDAEMSARLDLELKYAEMALRNGEGADALTRMDELLADEQVSPALRSRARRLRAEALESTGELNKAVRELDALHVQAVAAHDWTESLRLTIPLARCYKELGDIRHALTLIGDGLDSAKQNELLGSDAHAELAAMAVGLHYLLGDLAHAELLADEALTYLEGQGSRRARGSVYWNASLNAQARGNTSKALALADRALALYAEDDDVRGTARLRNAYAWLLLRTSPDRIDEAKTLLEKSLADLVDSGTAVDLAYCETELGRAWLLLGDAKQALRYATRAKGRLGSEPQHQIAHAELVIARAKLVLGDEASAIETYRHAAALLTRLHVGRQAAEAWRELADAFTKLSKFEDAAKAYQQSLAEVGVSAAPDIIGREAGTRRPSSAGEHQPEQMTPQPSPAG
jgi:transcriptional regulator with XRE-family HTH domain